MQKHKSQIKLLLKTTLGLFLVYYVLHSKMVDFDSLKTLLFSPLNLVLAFFFLSFSVLLCTARWLLLVKPQELSQSYRSLLSLSMIGSFFNTFMPGSVGGDLIKAWYIAGREPKKRTKAVFTVILDRILGLAVIVLYSAITLLFFTDVLKNNTQLQLTALSVWGFSLICIVAYALFFLPHVWELSFVQKILGLFQKNEKSAKLLDSILIYRNHFPDFSKAVILSALSMLGIIFFYSFIGGLLKIPLTTAQYFFIVPIALTVSAVPLLPGGIGTGQVAFYTLFKWMNLPDPEQGGTLCTLMQVYTILFNCLGALFYLKAKRKPNSILLDETSTGLASTNTAPCL